MNTERAYSISFIISSDVFTNPQSRRCSADCTNGHTMHVILYGAPLCEIMLPPLFAKLVQTYARATAFIFMGEVVQIYFEDEHEATT